MPRQLPVTADPNQRLLTQIEGRPAIIDLRWDDLSAAWYLSAEWDGRSLAQGRRVVAGLRLLPPATGWQLAAVALANNAPPGIGRSAWGTTHALFYVAETEGVSWLR